MEFTPLLYIPEPEHASMEKPSGMPPAFKPPVGKPGRRKLIYIGAFALVAALLFIIQLYVAAPRSFPEDTVITVERGETLSGHASEMEKLGYIKSPAVFKALVVIFKGERGLAAGDYYLERSQNAVTLAWRFSRGRYDLKNVRVTIPEGLNVKEIAAVIAKERKFTHFDAKEFIEKASKYEGYLFPDTYLFLPNIDTGGVIDAMLLNYQRRIEALAPDIMAFGRPIQDVINMASIIEEEARTDETRRIIAGILWKRLDDGMPLQVDAAFAFVNGKKDSRDLTSDDLKIDSPYNTYVKKGLPPTPIANPGLDAIRATVHPIQTKYYFYLSDDGGDMHYAVTHDEHVMNKQRYLSF